MPSVHFIAHHDREDAVARYRCLNFIDQLQERGWTAKFSYRFQRKPIEVAEDVVVLNRLLLDDQGKSFIERSKDAGKAVVYGLDDLIFSGDWADKERAEQNPAAAKAVWKQTMTFMEQTKGAMMLCDAALVSVEYLAERAAGLDKKTFVLRNTLPRELWEISSSVQYQVKSDKVILGYSSGTRTHNRDFDSIAAPLGQVLARHENAELMLVGPVELPSALARYERRVSRHGTVDWRKLPELLAQFDVNLAPLDLAFAFNHGKSHLKWLESAAVMVPTVASRTCELARSIEHGVDGFLASTEAEWESALDQLAANSDLRNRVGEAAYEKVSQQYTHSAQSAQTAAVFDAIRSEFCSAFSKTLTFETHTPLQRLRRRVRGLLGG